jgi:eukaryotic-like serine/threonine-protein kinase
MAREDSGECSAAFDASASSSNFAPASPQPPTVDRANPVGERTWDADPDAGSESPGPLPRPVIRGYEILYEVGRGGMGIVYKARQTALNRVVALKLARAGPYCGPEQMRCFQSEAEAAARLQHPNIIQIYDVGESEGRPFYAMEFVDGGCLAQRLLGKPLPMREAARLLLTLADAVAAAHRAGVLHRDLKPGNVLLASAPEPALSCGDPSPVTPLGTPKIVDFGLAKWLNATGDRNEGGSVLGTPLYMAPEQALGHNDELGPTCDVYSLGAILYETLTGRPPIGGRSMREVLLRVVVQAPVRPSRLNPVVDSDLEAICLRCLEKSPDRRYPSARALQEDLTRYLDGDSVRAQGGAWLGRLTRLFQRSRNEEEFDGLQATLTLFAAIVIPTQVVLFLVARMGGPFLLVAATRLVQFLLMGIVYRLNRRGRWVPEGQAGRQLVAVWVGYLAACSMVALLCGRGGAGTAGAFELGLYPSWCVLTGLAFWVMGAGYWGRFYAFGAAFFGLAALASWLPAWSPLYFGLLWALALLGAAKRLRRLPCR